MRKIDVFDTTLRDGEQSPGVSLTQEEKLEIARQLARLGVDIIEAGFAASSKGDFEAVKRIANEVRGVSICSLSRSVQSDIEQAWEALKGAEHPRIHVFLATSPIHMQYKLRMTPEQVLEQTDAAVRLARKFVSDVEFSAEDAGRSEPDFLVKVAEVAAKAGATVFNVPDTVGYLTPAEYANLFRYIRENAKGIENLKLSAHCHDDLGLAAANTLAAIEAGIDQVEGTINGIGERAGNVALEEVALALETRRNIYQATFGFDLSQIARTSRLVSKLTGMVVQPNKAIVGANAFAHESGIHQDGMLKEKSTYEIIRPETVGMADTKLVLGKHSGRHAFKDHITSLGYELDGEALNVVFRKFKELCDKKKYVTDEDILSLLLEYEVDSSKVAYRLEYMQVSCGTQGIPTATIGLVDDEQGLLQEAAVGNGAFDAISNAIDRITGEQVELLHYQIDSVTGGHDALAEVRIQLRQGEIVANGRAVSTDTLEAGARAYIDAINRIIMKRMDTFGREYRRLKEQVNLHA
ncbi:2-isopropylmalate synthase [Effusibacillus lacus]|uniref:2-isopropylmalate synthase n=1 Tax=Effusibacillus lacus TaxID=1348429 RepID=A0A292YRE0_9BACL|nr:2-isopropylmalate synthase [Effusibacillus lacus]TCS68941.1 2-isopropylmalate synthase [Effusibacillus lacus]GAX91489.1 2-isopropylmalate synthase [Effusibacillus lacus]